MLEWVIGEASQTTWDTLEFWQKIRNLTKFKKSFPPWCFMMCPPTSPTVPSSPWPRCLLKEEEKKHKGVVELEKLNNYVLNDSVHCLGGPIDSNWPLLNKLEYVCNCKTSWSTCVEMTAQMMWQWTELLWSPSCRRKRVESITVLRNIPDWWWCEWTIVYCRAPQFLVSVAHSW